MKFVALLLGFLASIAVATGDVQGQGGEVTLHPTPDGFKGEFGTGKQKLLIEHRNSNLKHLVSRIIDSTERTIVEAVQMPGSVIVRVIDVTVTISVDQREPGKSVVSELSELDRRNLEEFIRSDASAPIREILASIIRQKGPDGRPQHLGFLAIAMLLGDGPGAPDIQQSKRSCNAPKMVFASYLVPSSQFDSKHIFAGARTTKADDCLGCCGPSCWGCTGCYTSACLSHDVCVGAFGASHPSCMVLFAAAVASMCSECSICIIV